MIGKRRQKKERKQNQRTIHTDIVDRYLAAREELPLLQALPPKVHKSELSLPRRTRSKLAQGSFARQ